MPNVSRTLSNITRNSEERITREKAQQLKYPYEVLDNFPSNLEILSLMSIDEVRKWKSVPFIKQGSKVKVGVVHPENIQTITFLRQLANTNNLTLTLVVISESSLSSMVSLYEDLLTQESNFKEEQNKQEKINDEKDFSKHVKTFEDLKRFAQNVSTTELLDLIVASAVNLRASDIHIEPEDIGFLIRFRIDGVLQPAIHLNVDKFKPLVSRIKMHANLKIDLGEKPQDGRFSMQVGSQAIDFRVSSLPSQYGESIVLRILRQDVQQLSLEELGFNQNDLKKISEAINKPYGMVIITGPTGSGKTTTLYALLNKLNSTEKKIITLEDPIEYRLEGIEQSQIENSKNYSFADALRAALRQDPDIIMIGEIRDEETARIALNAALTGHLVLSTVHANNAVMAMPRLVDMNIEPFFLSGSINLIIAQRLVRKIQPTTNNTGPESYLGRTVISETLKPSADFERAVIKKSDFTTLLDIARDDGMVTMNEDGQKKVDAKITSAEEIRRVTQQSDL